VLDALWDLVWAGEVSNDTFAPLRSFLVATGRSKTPRRPALASTFPAHSAGRWSLVSQLMWETPDPTTRAAATVDQLLRRHGVLTRAAVAAEAVPGGFAGIYPVLARLEETGRVRRGYFIEGLGGAQFALSGAVDRLRLPGGDHRVLAIAATDPANPYGAALEWPTIEEGRIGRIAGAHVILVDGRLAGFADKRRLSTFGEPDPTTSPRAWLRSADDSRRLHGRDGQRDFRCRHRASPTPSDARDSRLSRRVCGSMPEGDSYTRIAALLRPALVGANLTAVDGVPAVRRWSDRLTGSRVEAVRTRGKHLLIDVEGDITIHVWMGMPGWWRVGPRAGRCGPRVSVGGRTTRETSVS
jgi:hypothetical protein